MEPPSDDWGKLLWAHAGTLQGDDDMRHHTFTAMVILDLGGTPARWGGRNIEVMRTLLGRANAEWDATRGARRSIGAAEFEEQCRRQRTAFAQSQN